MSRPDEDQDRRLGGHAERYRQFEEERGLSGPPELNLDDETACDENTEAGIDEGARAHQLRESRKSERR